MLSAHGTRKTEGRNGSRNRRSQEAQRSRDRKESAQIAFSLLVLAALIGMIAFHSWGSRELKEINREIEDARAELEGAEKIISVYVGENVRIADVWPSEPNCVE